MLKKVLAVAGLLFIAGLVYLIGFYRPRYESAHPLSLTEAKAHLKIELPPGAEQIWIFDVCDGPGHFRYMVRFRAPPESCLAWAGQLAGNDGGIDDIVPAMQLPRSGYPSWFDIRSIREGKRYSFGRSPIHEIWIDVRSGTVYYEEAD